MARYADSDQKRFKELVMENGGHFGIAQDEFRKEQIPEKQRCENCDGTGNQLYGMYQECEMCGGTGKKHFSHG